MILTLLKGYPDLIGRRQAFVGFGTGPASYNSTTGDVLTIPGYERYIDIVLEAALDPTGTYYAVAKPSAVGARATWALFWYTASSSAPVANGTNLSAFSLQVAGFGGEY